MLRNSILILFVVFGSVSALTSAMAQMDCSQLDPRASVSREMEGKVQASVGTLYKIAKAGGAVEAKVKDEIRNLQKGASVTEQGLIKLRTLSLFCGMVANAKDLSTERKVELYKVMMEVKTTDEPKSRPPVQKKEQKAPPPGKPVPSTKNDKREMTTPQNNLQPNSRTNISVSSSGQSGGITAHTIVNLPSNEANNEIQKTLSDIKQQNENCMEANVAYTHKKLEDLQNALVKLYSQKPGATDEDAKKWALEALKNAREFKNEIEELDKKRQQYNEGLSKELLDKTYRLFHYIFETVDSRLIALQEMDPRVKWETSDKLILFNDEKTKTELYTLRTVILPNRNRILIDCVPGELKQGLVSTCPSLEFVEFVEGRKMQSFRITPDYNRGGTITLSGGGQAGPLIPKRERGLRDVTIKYSAIGAEMLNGGFKALFNETFKEFFNVAYAR